WEEIDCKATAVPASVVPAKITQYVKANYPQVKVLQIDKKRNGYEVKLSNRMELEFNNNFQLTDMDND
ncbi:PepSY-like domain-containing protein, partial [Parabacteroides distasonis]